jgi:hypothetical protein
MVVAAGTSAFDQPGTLGFLVVFGMAVVLYFVFRSMAKHLRRVNDAARADAAAADASAPGADAAGTVSAGTLSAGTVQASTVQAGSATAAPASPPKDAEPQ